MKYLLEVENVSLSLLKEKASKPNFRYNISDFLGNYYYFGLGNYPDKKYFQFNVPNDIKDIRDYLEKNLTKIEFYPTLIEKPINNLKKYFWDFNDVYKTDDFILSSDDDTTFYLRSISNKGLNTCLDYRTIINVIRDYYADIWGIDLNVEDYSIIYLYTKDKKFCKIIICFNKYLEMTDYKNGKPLKLTFN